MKDDIEIIAANLKRLRKQSGMTQKNLAEKSGIPRSSCNELENGKGNPSLITLTKIANALAVSLSDLVRSPDASLEERIHQVKSLNQDQQNVIAQMIDNALFRHEQQMETRGDKER